MIHILLSVGLMATVPDSETCAPPADISVSEARNIIRFVGDINDCTVDSLLGALEANPDARVLQIASNGGEVVPAMVAGMTVYQRNMSVQVIGFCISSCAQYVAVAGAEIYVDEYGYLAFHSSATRRLNVPIFRESLEPFALEQYQGIANLEKTYFEILGVDPFILVDFDERKTDGCISVTMGPNGFRSVEKKDSYEFYVVDLSYLKTRYGLNILHPHHKTHEDYIRAHAYFESALPEMNSALFFWQEIPTLMADAVPLCEREGSH
jgi:hypothetical protein